MHRLIIAAGALVALFLLNVTADARAFRGGGYHAGGFHGARVAHVGGYRGGYRAYRGGYRRYGAYRAYGRYGYRGYGYRAPAVAAYGAGYYGGCGPYSYYDRFTGVCRRSGGYAYYGGRGVYAGPVYRGGAARVGYRGGYARGVPRTRSRDAGRIPPRVEVGNTLIARVGR